MSDPVAVVELDVQIRVDDVIHFLGYPEGRAPAARILAALDHIVHAARSLLDARGAFRQVPVEQAAALSLPRMEASGLVVGLVTAGARIENRAHELLEQGDPLRALLLEAAGSAAAEEAADRLGAAVTGATGLAATQTSHMSCRVSPGYGSWPIEAQRELLALLPAERVGVTLLDSMLMIPRKSISFAMWLGADARPRAGLSACATCRLERCRNRRTKAKREPS